VLHGRAPASLLATYEAERIAFARRLVATTDRAFVLITSRSSIARFVRRTVVPALVPIAFRLRAARRLMFRTVSQTAVGYRESPLSVGRAGTVHGGDRLPWVENADNFAPLEALNWQVHVYGGLQSELESTCRARGLAVHVFPWTSAMRRGGLQRDAVYLVRPDGHVALADPEARAATLKRYLDEHLGHPR
jgi:aromatic ring hydroxylase-like protein